MGVIYNPFSKELYQAVKGGGSFLNGSPLQVSGKTEIEQAVVVSVFFFLFFFLCFYFVFSMAGHVRARLFVLLVVVGCCVLLPLLLCVVVVVCCVLLCAVLLSLLLFSFQSGERERERRGHRTIDLRLFRLMIDCRYIRTDR